MTRVKLRSATAKDDTELRRLLREIPLEGRIVVRFLREPSYFDAAQVEGSRLDIVACEETATGRIVGMGSRAEREAFVNGEPTTIGYLSSLRAEPEVRNGLFLARGYRFLAELHARSSARLYLTTIIEENHVARRILTSRRAGLPAYRPRGVYHTLAISLKCRGPELEVPDHLTIHRAGRSDLPSLTAFLDVEGRKRQFFPIYRRSDLESAEGTLRGLEVEDIWLASRAGEIVGTLAVWDQRSFRQSQIDSYRGAARYFRPAYNAWAVLRGLPRLPSPGTLLRGKFLALVCVRDQDPATFGLLLSRVHAAESHSSDCDFLLLGLHEMDPLLEMACRWPHVEYRSRLYVVHWEDGEAAARSLAASTPYLELGGL